MLRELSFGWRQITIDAELIASKHGHTSLVLLLSVSKLEHSDVRTKGESEKD